jgi:hypothetical protein
MTVITMSRNELTRLRVLIVALRLPTLVFLLYQKGRDSRIFQAQDGYDRRDSEQQQVTADEDRGRLVRRP